MKNRNYKVQRRIFRFVIWSSVAGGLFIAYREHLWWTLAIFFLWSWYQASFRAITDSYAKQLEQMRNEPPFWCGNEQEGGARCDDHCKNCKTVIRNDDGKK